MGCKWYAFILNTDIQGITFMDPDGQCDVQATSVGEVERFDSDAMTGGLVVAVVVVVVTLGVVVYVWWRRRYIYIYIYIYIFFLILNIIINMYIICLYIIHTVPCITL